MLFNSLQFLFFFGLVTFLFFIVAHEHRWKLLLIASCYFYMAFIPIYILILALTIIVDYFAGIIIEQSEKKNRAKFFLVVSLITNIGILGFFKYYNFFIENINIVFTHLGRLPISGLSIILPIGLSFHTFQAMSYTIEVFRGNQKAERHFGIYALYVMFYPQLVAGPIERPQNLLKQFRVQKYFEYQRVVDGLKLMCWGMFKKVVIADRLAEMVNFVYNNPTVFSGISLILATVFFSIQIYCDFSGYSDIAIGSAQVMGIKLMRNFKRPYFSKSIAEFWSRWHISLSTWFKDYLYIPLGGNRVKLHRWFFNLMITFLISGLWHGANWNFILWGAIHGSYLILAIIFSYFIKTTQPQSVFIKSANAFAVFILVSFAWIFFRANTFNDASYVVKHLFSSLGTQLHNFQFQNEDYLRKTFYLGSTLKNIIISILLILFLFSVEYAERKGHFRERISNANVLVKWTCYSSITLLILYLGAFNNAVQFIYFQF